MQGLFAEDRRKSTREESHGSAETEKPSVRLFLSRRIMRISSGTNAGKRKLCLTEASARFPQTAGPVQETRGKSVCVGRILPLQRFVGPHEAQRRTWKSPDCRRCGKWEETSRVRRRIVSPKGSGAGDSAGGSQTLRPTRGKSRCALPMPR